MSEPDFRRVRELFLTAQALELEERSAFLDRVAGTDAALRAEVAAMLAAAEQNPDFLESPALGREFRSDAMAVLATEQEKQRLKELGPYRIMRLLGEGGFARVYLAEQAQPLKRQVAIKLLKPGLDTQRVRRRFEAERQALVMMDHPGIATILDAGVTEDGRPYFVMEYIAGQPITEYCARRGVSLNERLRLLMQVCQAVQHAHAKGVIHRDLKPSNVLIAQGGDTVVVKIIDFGIAKALGHQLTEHSLHTLDGQVLGTLPYASPEQVAGRPDAIDARSDVYALGAMLYELLSGQLPHDVCDVSIPEAALRITHHDPAPLGTIKRIFRGDLETIAAKALAKDPGDRYQTASELGADIGRYLRGEPIQARTASVTYQIGKLARRHKLAATGSVALLVVIAVAFVLVARAEQRARAQYQDLKTKTSVLLRTVIEDLAVVPGTANARDTLLTEVIDFVEAHQDDPELQLRYAEAMEARGDLELEKGELVAATFARQESLRIYERLVAAEPNDAQYQAALSVACVKTGDLSKERGYWREAEPWYRKALAIDEQLAKACPARRDFLDNLSWSYERLGHLAADAGDEEKAEDYYERRLELADRMLAEQPENSSAQYGLLCAHATLAELRHRRGDQGGATPHVAAALELAEALVLAEPNHRLYLRALAEAHRRAAQCDVAANPAEAFDHLDRAIVVAERLAALDEADTNALFTLAAAYSDRSAFACNVNDLNIAGEYCTRAIEVAEKLVAMEPDNPRLLRKLSRCHYWQAHVANKLDRPEEAAQRLSRALELSRGLVERPNPTLPDLKLRAHQLLADFGGELRNPAAALPLAERQAEMTHFANPLVLQQLAQARYETGNTQGAVSAIEQALEYTAPEGPRSTFLAKDLARYRAAITQPTTHDAPLSGP